MPRFNLDGNDRRSRQLQQQQLDQQQQSLDQSQQNGMVNQIGQLYGIQQQQQMQPGQLEAQNLTNLGLGIHNKLQPELAQSQIDTNKSLAGERDAKSGGVHPNEAAMLVHYGVWTPDQAREALMTPEQRAANDQVKAGENQAHWQNLEGDARANGVAGREGSITQEYGPDNLAYLRGLQGPPPATAFSNRAEGAVSNPYSMQSVLGSMGHDAGAQDIMQQLDATQHARRAKMTQEQLYNEQHPVDAVWNWLFGKPLAATQPQHR